MPLSLLTESWQLLVAHDFALSRILSTWSLAAFARSAFALTESSVLLICALAFFAASAFVVRDGVGADATAESRSLMFMGVNFRCVSRSFAQPAVTNTCIVADSPVPISS